jgi:hypothetical protein
MYDVELEYWQFSIDFLKVIQKYLKFTGTAVVIIVW